jgi:hypothetical protein
MARPLKQGVDYFAMDVHLDNKFKFLEIKFGLEGFAVVVKLLQYIYSNGYWASWDEDSMLIFADEKKIDPDRLYAIVSECINRKIFSQRMYEDYKILTSSGIQKRYKEMVRRRKDVSVVTEYLLIDNIYLVNDDKNSVNDDSMLPSGQHDDGKSTQRKGNKKEINKDMSDTSVSDLAFEEWYSTYPKGRSVRKQALASWNSLWKKNKIDIQELKDGTAAYLHHQQAKGYDICAAQVFLNQERWKDSWIVTDGKPKGPKQEAARQEGPYAPNPIPMTAERWDYYQRLRNGEEE